MKNPAVQWSRGGCWEFEKHPKKSGASPPTLLDVFKAPPSRPDLENDRFPIETTDVSYTYPSNTQRGEGGGREGGGVGERFPVFS